jgi:1-acyl-sn-glycerol-3-phosphate acyltransferase
LAREAGIPVVPIVLRGTRNALPKRGFVLQGRHAISVTVLPEVSPEQVAELTSADLTAHVQRLIAEELARTAIPEVSS